MSAIRSLASTIYNGLRVAGATILQVLRHEPVDLAIVTNAVAVDLTRSSMMRLTLTGDVSITNPSGAVEGTEFFLVFLQDSTGGRNVTWGTSYEWGSDGAPAFTDDAAATATVVHGLVVSETKILLKAYRGDGAAASTLTSNVTGNLTGNVTGNVTGNLTGLVNTVNLVAGSADPTAGGGVAATMPALYFRTTGGAGTIYWKSGAGDTAWTLFDAAD